MQTRTIINDVLPDGIIVSMSLEAFAEEGTLLTVHLFRENCQSAFIVSKVDLHSSDVQIIKKALQTIMNTLKKNGEEVLEFDSVFKDVISLRI